MTATAEMNWSEAGLDSEASERAFAATRRAFCVSFGAEIV